VLGISPRKDSVTPLSLQPKFTDRVFAAMFEPLVPRWIKPNHLTKARFVFGPLAALAFAAGRYGLSCILFTLAALTDWIDGALARTRTQTSTWGMLYEPIADKLLVISALVALAWQGVGTVLGLALCGIEAIAAIGIWRWHRAGKIEGANVWGKIKFTLEACGAGLLLLGTYAASSPLRIAGNMTLAAAIVFALISVYHKIR